MTISLIAAHTQNRTIGKANQLPWSLPDDMQYFMRTTRGHMVIMGRKNYDSIPPKYRPLPNRNNVVITRQQAWQAPGVVVVHSITEALALIKPSDNEVFVIGGAEIYTQALPYATKLYLTEIHTTLDGDRFFPAVEWDNWREVSRKPHSMDEKHKYSFDFVVYEKQGG